jgi:predicted nucleic acid-binding protein
MRVVLDTNVLICQGSSSPVFQRGSSRPGPRAIPVPADACDDRDDVKFLACAISGKATCVVSGDRALLRASGYERIEVLTPRSFVKRFLEQ